MSSIGGVGDSSSSFFFEASSNLQNKIVPAPETTSSYTLNSFDNTGKSSDFLSQFRNRLQKFQYSLTSNSFLSDNFSWKVKTAGVSDREKLLVKASTTALDKEYSVEINRLAGNRKALSEQLDRNDVTEFEEGTYSFNLTVGEETYSLDVEIDQTVTDRDKNIDVLRKVQSAIDGKDTNVGAFVTENKTKDSTLYAESFFKDVASLTIQSTATGTENAFLLQDTSGDLIEKLGLNRVRKSGNANQYAINANNGSTNSNSVALDTSLQAQFLETTNDRNTSVKVRGGNSDIEKELVDTIADYNDFIQWLDDNRRFVSSQAKNDIFQEIGSSLLTRRSLQGKENGTVTQGNISSALQINNKDSIDQKLADIGLQLNKEGKVNIEDDFSSALKKDLQAVHTILAGEEGFFSKVGSSLNDILKEGGERYILKQSNFLTYDTSGTKAKDIYLQGSSQIINVFA